jgi:hypothetical protein
MTTDVIKPTRTRVEDNTSEEANLRIRRQTEANVLYYSRRIDEIDRRLCELEQEWDIERSLEANAAVVILGGLVIGVFRPRWRLFPLVASAFLLQHALEGWCPPVELMRRLGIRTAREIHQERVALRLLRGDFRGFGEPGADPCEQAEQALEAASC